MTQPAQPNLGFNPSRLFILRPVATSLLMAALLLSGLIAYRWLPVAALPQIDYPTLQVVTLYPGASPRVMAAVITAPLERQFGQMPGLKQMSSSSSEGASMITLQFDLQLPLDIAEQTVQAAINAAGNFLPGDLPMPPVYNKVNPADAPILTLAVSSAKLPLPAIEDLVDTRLARKIAQVPGVGLVGIAGGQRPAVRIQANSAALAGYGLSLEDLRLAVAAANVQLAKGQFDGPSRSTSIDANDQLRSAAEYRRLIIAYRNGAPVRLADVAQVVDGAENARLAAWANHGAAVIVTIQRQPGSNVIEVARRVRQLLPSLQAQLPASVTVQALTDRTVTITASVKDVSVELLLAVALVVLVIYLFLRDLPATTIPAVVVPLSLVGSFGVMYLAGFSINNLTLMALTIATGFVVDDAIVVIENISRYLERGDPPLKAALEGAKQIGFTIISLTFSLVAVLIPLLFMQEVMGRLFREFAITLAVAILISALVSLTLTPMMCAKILKTRHVATGSGGGHADLLTRLTQGYGLSLSWALKRQKLVLGIAAAALALTVALFAAIPKGFFPVQDNGLLQGVAEAPGSISFAAMARRQAALAEAILADPAVASLSSFIGVDGGNPTLNSGRLLINLKPKGSRADLPTVLRRLRERLSELPGMVLYLQPVQELSLENRISRSQFQFTLQSPDYDELRRWAGLLLTRLKTVPALTDVASDLQQHGLEAYLDIDRAAASRLGVSIAAIDNALYNAYGQRLISTIFTQASQYRVVLEASPQADADPQTLADLRVPSSNGRQVPLSALARVSERQAPLALNHLDQFPAATVSFNLAPGAALSEAVQALADARRELGLPASVQIDYQGATQAFDASLTDTLWLILAAVVTVYIVLGVLYESYLHPLTILSTLPSAGVGALLALLLTGNDLSIIAVLGIILLIGIVKKNAIMMIDFALEAERRQGLAPYDAIVQACLLRFRPILMTTLAALLSALPLVLGNGMGAELRQPLGIALVGGLLFSQLLTLYTTPAIYLALGHLAARWSGAASRPEPKP